MIHGQSIRTPPASPGQLPPADAVLAAALFGSDAVHNRSTADPPPWPATSTEFMHARYFSPNLGRFLSVDPVGGEVGSSQSWNRYSYVLNNPLNFADPTGMEEDPDEEMADEGFWKRLWDKIVGKAAPKRESPEGDLQDSAELAEAAGLNPNTGQTRMVGLDGAKAFADGTREAVATMGAELSEEAAFALAGGGAVRLGGRALRLARELHLNPESSTSRQVLQNLDTPVAEFIAKNRKASIMRELPGEALRRGVTLQQALKISPKVRKLLLDARFAK